MYTWPQSMKRRAYLIFSPKNQVFRNVGLACFDLVIVPDLISAILILIQCNWT